MGLDIIILFVLAFLPPIFYVIWIRKTERFNREKWIPIFFWFTHVIVDEYQKNDGSYPNYSFLEKKDWEEKEGYPIKPRMEIIISTALSALIIVVELYFQFFS